MAWRWDQGRLDYFQLQDIKNSAKALVACDGMELPRGDEPDWLRENLSVFSKRPFLPESYKIWRNYKRVFGCQLLATDVNGSLRCTDLCKAYASDKITNDDYLLNLVKSFYLPSPVFDDYNPSHKPLFLGCSVIKLLISEFTKHNKVTMSLETIIGTLKNSKIDGTEGLATFEGLKRVEISEPKKLGDELRQFREFIIFISQLTYLKWMNGYLYLDVNTHDHAKILFELVSPRELSKQSTPALEILSLGSTSKSFDVSTLEGDSHEGSEDEFYEGTRIAVTHMRVERSKKLRDFFFSQTNINHHVCNMCDSDTLFKYPWLDRIVELHHLLPLSSSIKVDTKSTSLKDIVPLCPSCHRATHKYYSLWLKKRNQKDFASQDEALAVYNEAKVLIKKGI